jgi:non-ribosomal peptide synthase protein (TIGR01720 family)
MDDIQRRIAELSPEKRQLLDILLREREGDNAWGRSEYVAPRNAVENTLAKIWAATLGLPQVGIHDNFFELGGDSIQCIQILAKARHVNIHISANQMFANPTIAQLAELANKGADQPPAIDPIGDVPLTPIQSWFLEQEIEAPHHWNQAVLLECKEDVRPELLLTAFRYLIQYHDALRLRWRNARTGEGQTVAGEEKSDFFQVVEAPESIDALIGATHEALDLVNGPIFRAVFIRAREGLDLLLVVTHHLAADAVSFRILFDDLETVCRQLLAGESPRLPEKTTSFREWALRLNEYADSDECRNEVKFWQPLVNATRIPLDFADGDNVEESVEEVSFILDKDQTAELRRRSQLDDVLLSAVHRVITEWAKGNLSIDVEGHGRVDLFPGVDLSRTIGWFTTITPVSSPEQRRLVPNHGISYGLLRYLSREFTLRERLRTCAQSEVAFNYLGQFDHVLPEQALFRPIDFAPGPLYSARARRRYVFQIAANIYDARLHVTWYYSRNLHRKSTIELLSGRLRTEIHELQPADFPLSGLSKQELDELIEM